MNFEFILPQKIIFGQGSITRVGEESKELGARRVLIVTSRGMLKRESLKEVTASLKDYQLNFEIFSNVAPEPPIENVYDCISLAKKNEYNLIIGLGGGSVLDVAKKAAADLGLPKIMAPTTAGTGSEVTHESVLKVDGKKKAFVEKSLVPNVALVDPDLTETAPLPLAASSGIDALAHAVECYESRKSNLLVKTLALEASKLLRENIQKAMAGNDEARINMSLGSLIAGMAFGNSGTALGHALSYPLSNRGIPHGAAVAIVLPYAMEFNNAEADFISKIKEVTMLIEPRWGNEWDVEDMVKEVMKDEKHLANNPRQVTYEDVLRIFEQIRNWLTER